MQTVKNVFNNVSPIRTYNAGSDFKETATHVVPEVVVQRVVSKMFGKGAPQPILDSALMHALSVPWIGAFAFFGPKFHPTLSGDYTKQFTAGAAGIPAVLFARYLIELIGGERILHLPWDNMRDLLVMAVSKIITRPVVSSVGKFLPDTIQEGYNFLQQRFDGQAFQGRAQTPGAIENLPVGGGPDQGIEIKRLYGGTSSRRVKIGGI